MRNEEQGTRSEERNARNEEGGSDVRFKSIGAPFQVQVDAHTRPHTPRPPQPLLVVCRARPMGLEGGHGEWTRGWAHQQKD